MSNALLANNGAHHTRWEPKHPFDLVIAYEDTTTRNRALRLYDHLANQMIDDHDFQCSWWKLDHLQSPTLMEQAVDAAVEAHMVVVSVRSGESLPGAAQRWLELWVPRRDHHGKSALVSLVAGAELAAAWCPIRTALQKTARVARMDFFAHAFDAVAEQTLLRSQGFDTRFSSAEFTPETLSEQRPPFPRWGINE